VLLRAIGYTARGLNRDTMTERDTDIMVLGRGYLVWKKRRWTIEFSWVKAHVGIYGKELADKLAKDGACNKDTTVSFNRIPKSTLYKEMEEEATQKWQREWENCTKAGITKRFFPNVETGLN
jgi:hypothetical protein